MDLLNLATVEDAFAVDLLGLLAFPALLFDLVMLVPLYVRHL